MISGAFDMKLLAHNAAEDVSDDAMLDVVKDFFVVVGDLLEGFLPAVFLFALFFDVWHVYFF